MNSPLTAKPGAPESFASTRASDGGSGINSCICARSFMEFVAMIALCTPCEWPRRPVARCCKAYASFGNTPCLSRDESPPSIASSQE